MNRRSFLYILAKLHAKKIKSKQDTAKSFAYYNVAGACRLLIVSANVQYRPTETIHRESSAFRVRARIFRASCERDGPRIALAIAFRVTRLQVRVTRLQVRVVSICIGGRIIEYRDTRPVYTTSGLGTAPQKMGTVPKLLRRYLLVYTTNSNRHDFIVSTVPIGKRHLYFLLTTVQFVSGQGTPVIFHVSLQYR